MSKARDGGPAFPLQDTFPSSRMDIKKGMSLRDWFAGQALAGMMANCYEDWNFETHGELVGTEAYRIADSMLKARGKKEVE